MANTARALVELALRERKLDRTLTTALPSLDALDVAACATDIPAVDACLRGGLPRGQLCELTGPRSSGRTTLLLQVMAAATRRGELAALVDVGDRLDVASAEAAGIDLTRLLWVRGTAPSRISNGQASGMPAGRVGGVTGTVSGTAPGTATAALVERALERALKALNLILQAGGFGVVVLDVADVPVAALKRLPFTTWLRLQRAVEGRDTTCVLVVPEPLARSAGGQTVSLTGTAGWTGNAVRSRRLASMDIAARVVSPRRQTDGLARFKARMAQ